MNYVIRNQVEIVAITNYVHKAVEVKVKKIETSLLCIGIAIETKVYVTSRCRLCRNEIINTNRSILFSLYSRVRRE